MRANTNAIVCRSIHEEKSGEFILVGVVVGALQVHSDRFEQAFDLFMTVSDLPAGDYPTEFRLISPSEKPSLAKFLLSIPEDNVSVNLQVSGLPFVTTRSGAFKVEWRLPETKRWEKLVEIQVFFTIDVYEADRVEKEVSQQNLLT